MEKLRRRIDDESAILESLKHTADAHNSLLTLQEQCEKDIDALDENFHEETYKLNKFDILAPASLPRDGDDEGDQLVKVFQSMMQQSRDKHSVAAGRLDRCNDDMQNTQKIIAEKSAVLVGNQKTLTSHRTKLAILTASLHSVQETVEELREHEARLGYTLNANEENPRELIKYIDSRLDELEEEDSPGVNVAKVTRKVLKRLRKMVCVVDRENRLYIFLCLD
jgi:DNA repair protein RAD50